MDRIHKDFTRLDKRFGRTRLILGSIGILFVLVMLYFGGGAIFGPSKPAAKAPPAIAVDVAAAKTADVPIYVDGLGSVQAFYTVTVTPRVDGELQSVGFVEGQMVKKDDLLAQIDPRLYQAAFDQASATREKDAAQLDNARHDLERYTRLAPQNFTSKQTLDTQRALVAELVAQVKNDQAQVDNAKTQLDYTHITSPISGRTGIRMVDPGNNLHAANSTGIVVVTQVQPISLIFTLPEEDLPGIRKGMENGPLQVMAMARDGTTELDRGTVLLIDNQIDPTTGTIRLKATFPNVANRLWPGDYIDAKVLEATRRQVLTVPSSAIQRGPNGIYVYVVKADSTVEMRPLETAEDTGTSVIVTKGLKPGEKLTTSNAYRLLPGIHVSIDPPGKAKDTKASEPASGNAQP